MVYKSGIYINIATRYNYEYQKAPNVLKIKHKLNFKPSMRPADVFDWLNFEHTIIPTNNYIIILSS